MDFYSHLTRQNVENQAQGKMLLHSQYHPVKQLAATSACVYQVSSLILQQATLLCHDSSVPRH